MNEIWFYFLSTFSLIFLLSKLFSLKQTQHKKIPPRPPAIPIIGHLHLMKEPLHRTLQNITDQYGPIVSLSFGSRNIVVVSSPNLLEDCFHKNDLLFANRPHLSAFKYLGCDYTTLGTSPYGDHWRNLRRIASVQIFSTNRLNNFDSIRQDEVRILLKSLFANSQTGFTKVEMKSRLSGLSFNIISRMISGERYFGTEVENLEVAKRFGDILKQTAEVSGGGASATLNLGDFLPFLRWVDFRRIEKRLLRLQKNLDEFCQSLIDEHRKNNNSSSQEQGRPKTMIGKMLSLQESEPESYSDEIIKGFILVMLLGGTGSAVAVEWAMSLLLNHPEVLKKARAELDKIIGQERLVGEDDFPKLPYLQSIINETQRLYPVAPLVTPHESSDDCFIGGYYVPRGTMLLVNAWAIHSDPTVWNDPTKFRPERFEGLDKDAHKYKLIPFGLGRRACPGAPLANRVMSLTLASLIQCFEWERPSEEQIDMCPGTGDTMPKSKPLEAMCRARESMINILHEL
ncbi:hypothetical protein JCGZ_16076 [Jatropha curcas]|uniref:Cytochrome P450 n=1 Tax=Jatropha curcas TaxID=180498 RepID=A0A067LC56_JATCU|nr:cytochrome P450 81Q32 isoform X1 [Jatropha curcas]KDP41669.1 hypothetical protein JCGZ_16076 [Jatropha curcas]